MKTGQNITIILGLIIYCFAFQGLRGLYESDEGRYTAVAEEMIRLGDWVHPHLNHETPHWTKPPLTYWAIAASISVLGNNEYAARLPVALAFFFTILLIYRIGQAFLDCRPWVAPLIYCSSLFPFIASNVITTDVLLTLWETAAVCAFVQATWGKDKQMRSLWMLAMWIFFGLAFMTKGPPGLFPLIAITAYLRFVSPRDGHHKLSWFPGIIVFLLITVPWFAYVIHDSPELISYFFKDEIIGRVVGKHHRNAEWYGAIKVYLPVLILGTLPWTYWIIRDCYRGIKRLVREGIGVLSALNDSTRFLLLWFACPLMVFVFVASRLPLYILPLFAPLSLLTAQRLSGLSSLWTPKRISQIGCWMIFLLVLRVVAGVIPSRSDARFEALSFDTIRSGDYDEVLFYEMGPVYGLNFYLGKEVENIDQETLGDELSEAEKRLWIVKPGKRIYLENEIRRYPARKLHQIGQLKSGYFILQEVQTDRAL